MLQVRPRKAAISPDCALEVLVTLDPDQLPPRADGLRIPLNLALVLDRSGSMRGEKIELTKQAACRALGPLTAEDHLSLVIFDDQVDLIYSGRVQDKAAIEHIISQVEARHNTNLHGGWLRGVQELSHHQGGCLSRAIVLTDGETNQGIVDPEEICRQVGAWAAGSVQTTTLGFGAYYNEELLKQMAAEGGGNHGYVENAERLAAFFDEEMASLLKARGNFVRLQIVPPVGGHIEWLVTPRLDRERQVCLGNLVEGQPLAMVFRWKPGPKVASGLTVEVSWTDLETGQKLRQQQELLLPVVAPEEWEKLPNDAAVDAQLARAEAELRRQGAMQLLRQQQFDAAYQWLGWALQLEALPEEEKSSLLDLQETVARRDTQASLKKAAMYSHGHGHGHARVSAHYAQAEAVERKQRPRLTVPLADGPVLHRPWQWPAAPWKRLEGMLRGHFWGERLVRGDQSRLGEGATLTVVTLRHQINRLFQLDELAEDFHNAPLLHPTTSQQRFRRAYEKGDSSLLEVGGDSAGCAALRRVCPFLVVYRRNPLLDALLATLLTHRDNLALTSCVGYLSLLASLLRQALPPSSDFYLNAFCSSIAGLEQQRYGCATGKFRGWNGYLKDFLPMAIGHAREHNLRLDQAMECWGSGPYLLEVVPTLLYALELHAHEPWAALLKVTEAAVEADTLGMLTGAAVGALHGSQPGWFLDPEIDKLLGMVHDTYYAGR